MEIILKKIGQEFNQETDCILCGKKVDKFESWDDTFLSIWFENITYEKITVGGSSHLGYGYCEKCVNRRSQNRWNILRDGRDEGMSIRAYDLLRGIKKRTGWKLKPEYMIWI